MIIDPPPVFASLEDWLSFQSEMETLVKAEPDNAIALEYLGIANAEVLSFT